MGTLFFLPQQFSTSELADLLSISRQAVKKRADARGWKKAGSLRKGRGGGAIWIVTSLDEESRNDALAEWARREEALNRPALTDSEIEHEKQRLDFLAEQFVRKPEKIRRRAQRRLSLLLEAIKLNEGGMGLVEAFKVTAISHCVKWANLRNWYYGTDKKPGVKDLPRHEWIYALVDHYVGRRPSAEFSEKAYSFFFGLYLHKKAPDLSECYRRTVETAAEHGWIVPSERTVRRIVAQQAQHLIGYKRGQDKHFRNVMPPQQRDHSFFYAGEALNFDGLHLDIWTLFEDGEVVEHPVVLAGQDIRSSKAVSYRLGKTENTDLYRLSIYDALDICTPKHIWTDNTRAAANKLITGNGSNRHRFTNNPDDPIGLAQHAGIEHHFTSPNHEMSSPGAKPVERIFGKGGIHQMIRNNPHIREMGTLKNPVPVALLLNVIAEEIARFNARTGRRGKGMNGRSFDQVFAESFSKAHVSKVSPFIKNLFLLDRETVTIQKDGLIAINAGRGEAKNRYWSTDSRKYAKQKVTVYFDPDNLTKDIHICLLDGSFVGCAQYQPSVAFIDKQAGKQYAKARASMLKAEKKAADALTAMSTMELQQHAKRVTAAAVPSPASSHIVMGNIELNRMMSDKGKKDYSSLYANRDRKLASM